MNSDDIGIIIGVGAAVGAGLYLMYDYFIRKTVHAENTLKIYDSPIDLHIIMKTLPRYERVCINNTIVSSIDLQEITFLSSGSFAIFIPMLVIWSFDYFKYRQTILPVKPSSRIELPEEVEYWHLIHSTSWEYRFTYRHLIDNRNFLLGIDGMVERILGPTQHIEPLDERERLVRFNIMLEIINRQPRPLELLRELDWTMPNLRDTDLYVTDVKDSKLSALSSWDKLSHSVELDSKYQPKLDNAILITEKYVPTFHFKWFTENIDFDLLEPSEIWDYIDILPGHKQQMLISSLDKFYKTKKMILKHSLVKNVAVDIAIPEENLNNLI